MTEIPETQAKLPISFLNILQREEMAKTVARFIKARPYAQTEAIPQEIYMKAFDVAFLLTSSFEGNSNYTYVSRSETVEAAVDLLERSQKYL